MIKDSDNIKRSDKVNHLLESKVTVILRYGAILLILFFTLLFLLYLKLPIIEGMSLAEYFRD